MKRVVLVLPGAGQARAPTRQACLRSLKGNFSIIRMSRVAVDAHAFSRPTDGPTAMRAGVDQHHSSNARPGSGYGRKAPVKY